MTLRLVRCPFCDKRFNVTGIVGGTHLQCSGCNAILSVPRDKKEGSSPQTPLHRRRGLQVAAIAAGAVVLAVTGFLIVPRSPAPKIMPSAPEVAVVSAPVSEIEKPAPSRDFLPFFDRDERLVQAKQKLMDEFGAGRLRFLERPPFLIAVERSDRYNFDDIIKDYASRLDLLYHLFRREFGESSDLPEVREVLPVIVFNSRVSYEAYYSRMNDGQTLGPEIHGLY